MILSFCPSSYSASGSMLLLMYFSKFYGKVGIISWLLFHLIWKNYILYWDFVLKSWIVDFFTRFTCEKTPQNNFPCQNFSVENNYIIFFEESYVLFSFKTMAQQMKFYFALILEDCIWNYSDIVVIETTLSCIWNYGILVTKMNL